MTSPNVCVFVLMSLGFKGVLMAKLLEFDFDNYSKPFNEVEFHLVGKSVFKIFKTEIEDYEKEIRVFVDSNEMCKFAYQQKKERQIITPRCEVECDTTDRGDFLRSLSRVYLKLGLGDKDKRVKFIVKSKLNATLDEEVDYGALPRIYSVKITINGEHYDLFDRQAFELSPGDSDLTTCAVYGDDPQAKELVVEVNPRTYTEKGTGRVCVKHKVVRRKGEIIEANYQLKGIQEVTGEFLLYFRDDKECPPDSSQLDSFCYKFVKTPLSWANSRSNCISMKGFLAEPKTYEPITRIKLMAKYFDRKNRSWIGASDMDNDKVWKWDHSGTTVSTGTWPLEKRCMSWAGLVMSPDVCSRKHPSFCQIPAIDPTADVNECRENRNICPSTSTCYNTIGSYICVCFAGIELDGDALVCTVCTDKWLPLYIMLIIWFVTPFTIVCQYAGRHMRKYREHVKKKKQQEMRGEEEERTSTSSTHSQKKKVHFTALQKSKKSKTDEEGGSGSAGTETSNERKKSEKSRKSATSRKSGTSRKRSSRKSRSKSATPEKSRSGSIDDFNSADSGSFESISDKSADKQKIGDALNLMFGRKSTKY